MTIDSLPKIIVVCGPTGVGKTTFAIRLARRFAAEIVGADSMQIYRYMDIGTAKPTDREKDAVAHHMVDIIDPDAPFDAAAYRRMASAIIQRLTAQGVVPFVVGGTGLYIRALVFGLFTNRPLVPGIRQKLQRLMAQEGAAAMHDRLAARDARAAAKIHPNDSYRILRALEVIEGTGRPISALHREHGFRRKRYQVLSIGLTLPRQALYQRIDQRVDAMIANGLLEEVRGLLARGYEPRLKSLQSLGYRHMADFLQGRLAWDDAVRTLKRDHRRYAKRQLTWFRADAGVNWLVPHQEQEAADLVSRFLTGP